MPKKSSCLTGALYILAAAALWSTGGLFIKMIPWSPLSINSARCLIALAVNFLFLRKRSVRPVSRMTLFAGICFGLTATFLTVATKLTTAANAILLQYTSPLFIILFESLRLRRTPKRIDLICAGGIILGIFLCCTGNFSGGQVIGNAVALLSGVCFAFMFLASAHPAAEPSNVNLIGFFLGFTIGLPWLVSETAFSFPIFLWVIVLGIGQFWFAYTLFGYGIRRVSPLTANFLSTLEPVLNPIWVAVFYGESIGGLAIIGGAITITAAISYSTIPAVLTLFSDRNSA